MNVKEKREACTFDLTFQRDEGYSGDPFTKCWGGGVELNGFSKPEYNFHFNEKKKTDNHGLSV